MQTETALTLILSQRIGNRGGILSAVVAHGFTGSIRFGLVGRTRSAILVFGISDRAGRHSIEQLAPTRNHEDSDEEKCATYHFTPSS